MRKVIMSDKQRKQQSGGLPDWLSEELDAVTGGRTVDHVENIGESEAEQMAILGFSSGPAALVKWNEEAPDGLFEQEAGGMRMLRQATGSAVYVPEVLGFGDKWLMMEDIKEGDKADAAVALGRGLAAMHKQKQERFGYGEDNYLGPLMQPNEWRDKWVDFFREQRLQPAMEWLKDKQARSGERRRQLEAVAERLDQWLDVEGITPSLLHGHLTDHSWMARNNGQAVLVDPAPYYGHREVDLAALRLLGEPPQSFWEAYEEVWPLDEGFEERVPVYQLYYVLAHMAMGEEDGDRLDQILRQLTG
jgi:fructosamine-3-kinase